MNRLVLVPCIVVASYVALASYVTSPSIGFKIPTSVSNSNKLQKEPRSQPTNSVQLSAEVPNERKVITKSYAAVSPETPHQDALWVTVLLPARVHTGPSVDTPISQFYPVGTPLRATRYQDDWFQISEPGSSPSGWIYRKYLGAISNSERGKVASQEAQKQRPVAKVSVPTKRYAKAIQVNRYTKAIPAKRYAKVIPAKRYASTVRWSRQSDRIKSVSVRPVHGHTEMASLLQRAFSGY
jgi:hypothetical protein